MFAAASRRRVEPAEAAAVGAAAPLELVGVFVNENVARIASHAAALDLAAVQLHGDESREDVATLRRLLPASCAIWKAAPGRAPLPLRESFGADRVLLDGAAPGSGRVFDWGLLDAYPETREAVLAGGLDPENACAADRLGAWALDVSSGVEEAPGRKSDARLAAFLAALRGQGRSA